MIFKRMFAIIIYLMVISPTDTAAARYFDKFWSFSLVFPNLSDTNVDSITLVMPMRAECVSLCVMKANCCCTQWVPSTNTCTILMADRAGLSPNPLAVSSIDSANNESQFVLNFNKKCLIFYCTYITL